MAELIIPTIVKSPRRHPATRSKQSEPRSVRRSQGDSKLRQASAVLQHIRELFRVSQEHFKRVEARCGVSGVQVWAAAELKARAGMTISELSRALSIHLSTASNLLDRMEARGLVRRERGHEDQRVVRVFLTSEGQKMLRKAPEPAEGVIPDALERMSASALLRLNQDLEKLLQLARIRDRRAAMKPLAEP